MKNGFIGIDVGTSGIRASVIDDNQNELFYLRTPLNAVLKTDGRCEADPLEWKTKTYQLLQDTCKQLNNIQIKSISIDATSSTLIACDQAGKPLGKALMYNDQQSEQQALTISKVAPNDCAAHGASSSLAKALTLLQRYPTTSILCHQADWLSGCLSGEFRVSDENNCLKMGYDIVQRNWPDWLFQLGISEYQLPKVIPPGRFIAKIDSALAEQLGLPNNCEIISGTTDSIAAVIATGAKQAGDAVTSLGSTLVIKLLSENPVFAPEYGIYSHRLGEHWLVGGASNAGGAVLKSYFTQDQLDTLTAQLCNEIELETTTGLNYYPLPATGERFPVNDASKQPKLSPRPKSDLVFFQAILEGISEIEKQGYNKLLQLGAGKVNNIVTCGGGNKNQTWRKMRENMLGVPVVTCQHTEASYGSALLARQGWIQHNTQQD